MLGQHLFMSRVQRTLNVDLDAQAMIFHHLGQKNSIIDFRWVH